MQLDPTCLIITKPLERKENNILDTPDGGRLMSSLALAYFDRPGWCVQNTIFFSDTRSLQYSSAF